MILIYIFLYIYYLFTIIYNLIIKYLITFILIYHLNLFYMIFNLFTEYLYLNIFYNWLLLFLFQLYIIKPNYTVIYEVNLKCVHCNFKSLNHKQNNIPVHLYQLIHFLIFILHHISFMFRLEVHFHHIILINIFLNILQEV